MHHTKTRPFIVTWYQDVGRTINSGTSLSVGYLECVCQCSRYLTLRMESSWNESTFESAAASISTSVRLMSRGTPLMVGTYNILEVDYKQKLPV